MTKDSHDTKKPQPTVIEVKKKIRYQGWIMLYMNNIEIIRRSYSDKRHRRRIIGRWMEEYGCDFQIGIEPRINT